MSYQGDILEDATITFSFSTRDTAGLPTTLAGTPVLSVYKDTGTTESVAGITLSVDHDGVTGLNNVEIDSSADAFYAAGSDYYVVITTGTVDGGSVVGEVVGTFSIQNRYATVNVGEWLGTAVATPSVAGVPEVDITHVIGNSGAASSLKSLTDMISTSGTAQGPGANGNQIQLNAGGPSTSDIFDPATILLVGGTGTGQSRRIIEYDGTTKTCTVGRTWKTNPASDTDYIILADPGGLHVNEGLAQAGAASTITLNALASSSDDAYNGQTVFLVSGAAEDQARVVVDYNGTSKVATVNRAWDVQPTGETGYLMLPALDCANLERIGGNAQSATDLKHFADSGYDPATSKVEGVKLTDTTTTNTDMRGTDSAALAVTLDGVAANLIKTKAAVYDSATEEGDVITLSNGTTQDVSDGRVTVEP